MRHIQPLRLGSIISGLLAVVPAFRQFGRGLLDLALPPRCMHCDIDLPSSTDILLCTKCLQLIAPELPNCCGHCGAVLAEWIDPKTDRCPACKDFSLKFDAVYHLGKYDGALRDVVLKTKRASSEALSLAIGRLLATRLHDKIVQFGPDAIVPIPMHWRRRLGRGVNSPELFAGCLSKALGTPMLRRLRRVRYTKPQKDLSPSDRLRNVCGAFGLRGRRRWQGARVLLVDDILTTGATCSEAAGLFKQAGAAAVTVAVVARADRTS